LDPANQVLRILNYIFWPLTNSFTDVTGYLADKPINEFYIAIVGDINGGRNKDAFTAQEKGKIGGFLNRYEKRRKGERNPYHTFSNS
jgi:hypothetical protein